MSEVLSYQQFQEALDSVNSKAVKKKFKDRKDKDIDNDGDVDSSDKFLHKRRKAISKAVKNEDMMKPMTSAQRAKEMQKKADKVKRDAEAKLKKAKGITMGEGKYAKYSDLLLKKQRMKKMGQNTMVVDKEIEAEKKKIQSQGTMKMKKESLYANIHKKRKEGRPMRKKGEKGAPSEKDFDNAKKTAKEEVDPRDLRGRPKKDSHPNSPYGVKHPMHPANIAKRKEKEKKKAQSANEERENCHSKDHDCATVVEHIVWGFGKPVYESHAVPTDDGFVSWYDVEFEHGVEKEVPTEDLKIYTTEDHSKYMKPKSKKSVNKSEMYAHKKKDKNKMIDEGDYSDAEIAKAVDIAKKMAGHNYTGATNAINKMKKGLASVGKVKYALKKAAESFETFNGLSISEVKDLVKDLTDSAQDYIKLVESGDLESADEPDVEIAKGMPLSFKQFKSKIGD